MSSRNAVKHFPELPRLPRLSLIANINEPLQSEILFCLWLSLDHAELIVACMAGRSNSRAIPIFFRWLLENQHPTRTWSCWCRRMTLANGICIYPDLIRRASKSKMSYLILLENRMEGDRINLSMRHAPAIQPSSGSV